MSAETLRKAAEAERAEWGDPDTRRIFGGASAVHLALADWLDVEAEHIASHDCEAHCEPDGCARSLAAYATALAILGGAS